MSTKIYNAYKYQGSILSLQKQLRKIRTKQLSEFEGILGRTFLSDLKKDANAFNIGKALKAFMQAGTNIPLNFKSSIVVYFHSSGIYVQTYGVNEDFIPRSFKDFHYQNSTDDHEGISDKEWDYRLRIWDSIILKEDLAPIDAGFAFRLLDEGNIEWFTYCCWRNIYRKEEGK